MLKGQDIALIIKLLLNLKSNRSIEHTTLAFELFISQSEVSKGMLRLEKAKLLSRYSDKSLEVHKHALCEMLIHGLKYFMVADLNLPERGIVTAHSYPSIQKLMVSDDEYVWPFIDGDKKGIAISPIYKTLPNALYRNADKAFHEVMSTLDLMRLGGSRETQVAKEILEKTVWE